MNLFRSEEHIARWLAGRGGGATIGVLQLARLARTWYAGRLAPDWRPRTREQSQTLLDDAGLKDAFWRLA